MIIHDVKIIPLKIIADDRGSVMHMLRNDDIHFEAFGEIYFSTIFKNKIKAWHLHKESTLNYVCVKGNVKLVLYDDRPQSKTRGIFQEVVLSKENYSLVTIPKKIWNGFKGLGENESIIANCLTMPHNEKEMVRIDPYSKNIDYNWR